MGPAALHPVIIMDRWRWSFGEDQYLKTLVAKTKLAHDGHNKKNTFHFVEFFWFQ
jgi:hypothetical protein